MRRLLAASLVLAVSAAAAQPARQLREAERASAAQLAAQLAARAEAAEQARQAQAEEKRLAEQRAAAAARLHGTETEAARLADQVAALAERRRGAEARLAERAAAMAPLLPLAERLSLYPAETLLAVPAPPQDTLRGLSVLRGLMQELDRQSALLRTEQAAVESAERELAAALPRLRAAQASQASQAAGLDHEIEAARAVRLRAEDAATDAARRAAAEAARAESLRGAIAAIDMARSQAEQAARDEASRAERRAGQDRQRQEVAAEARRRQESLARPAGPGVEPRGGAVTPVAGAVVTGWGDRTEAGPANGVSYRAAPLARVVAPCAGRVAFAGPFRSFGVLVILDCGGGYHFVLAGLERLDVGAGAAVLAGEPVGVMPGWDPAAAGAGRPALYVELRHDGQAVNPAPFLRTRG